MSDVSQQVVLYDIPSKPPCKCWSLNPWKARFLLNYKGIDYRTEWTEYPDLKLKLQDQSVLPGQSNTTPCSGSCLPPNDEGAAYSSPTIQLPDRTFVMNSKKIAKEIERRYPDPPLHLDAPQINKLEIAINNICIDVAAVFISLVSDRLLNDASKAHYSSSVERRFGASLAEFEQTKGGPQAWQSAKPWFDQVTDMLNEDSSGPYFLGSKVSFADFMWGGFLIFAQRIGDDQFEQVLATASDHKPHVALLAALEKWFARQD